MNKTLPKTGFSNADSEQMDRHGRQTLADSLVLFLVFVVYNAVFYNFWLSYASKENGNKDTHLKIQQKMIAKRGESVCFSKLEEMLSSCIFGKKKKMTLYKFKHASNFMYYTQFLNVTFF